MKTFHECVCGMNVVCRNFHRVKRESIQIYVLDSTHACTRTHFSLIGGSHLATYPGTRFLLQIDAALAASPANKPEFIRICVCECSDRWDDHMCAQQNYCDQARKHTA
jgi:hypothetical protein